MRGADGHPESHGSRVSVFPHGSSEISKSRTVREDITMTTPAPPVTVSVTTDKSVYNVGDTLTATVTYADSSIRATRALAAPASRWPPPRRPPSRWP